MTAKTPLTAEIHALLDSCAAGPVLVPRPDRFDVVILSTAAYADLIDRSQSVQAIGGDDPLLAELAAEMADRTGLSE